MHARLHRWHRRLGLAAALFVLFVAATGVLINHADALGLPDRQLRADWLLTLYGLEPPPLTAAQAAGGHWVSQWGTQLALDAEPLPAAPSITHLLGAFEAPGLLLVADRRQLLLLTPEGALVDRLPLPEGFVAQRAGRAGAELVVEDEQGRRLAVASPFGRWHEPAASLAPRWAQDATLPAATAAALRGRLAGPGVSAEQLLLDMHSGRWLGRAGVWLTDLVALALLGLAATGAIAFGQRWQRNRHRRDHHG